MIGDHTLPFQSVVVTDAKYDDLLALWTLWTYTTESHHKTQWTIILANILNADRAMTLVNEVWGMFIKKSEVRGDHIINIYRGDAGAMWDGKIYEQRHEKLMFGSYVPGKLQYLEIGDIPKTIHRYYVMAPFKEGPNVTSADIIPRLTSYNNTPAIKATGIGYNTSLGSLNESLSHMEKLHALMPIGSCDVVFNNNTTWKRDKNRVVGTISATHPLNTILPRKFLHAALEDSGVFRKDQINKISSALKPLGIEIPSNISLNHIENAGLEGKDARHALMLFLNNVRTYVDGEDPWNISIPYMSLDEKTRKQFGNLAKIMDAYSDPNFGDINHMTVEVTDCLQMTLVMLKDLSCAERACLGRSATGRFITLDPIKPYPDNAYYIYTGIDMLSIADILFSKLA